MTGGMRQSLCWRARPCMRKRRLPDAAGVQNAQRAWQNWTLNCQGCHRPDGTGSAGTTQASRARWVSSCGCRKGGNISPVCPALQPAPLSDAEVPRWLNWMVVGDLTLRICLLTSYPSRRSRSEIFGRSPCGSKPRKCAASCWRRPALPVDQAASLWRHGFWFAVSAPHSLVRAASIVEKPVGELPPRFRDSNRVGSCAAATEFVSNKRWGARSSVSNYEYLDIWIVRGSRSGRDQPRGGLVCDVGCASFWYAAALHAFFRPERLVGVEIEGHRVFRDGRARIDYALGLCAGCRTPSSWLPICILRPAGRHDHGLVPIRDVGRDSRMALARVACSRPLPCRKVKHNLQADGLFSWSITGRARRQSLPNAAGRQASKQLGNGRIRAL